METVAVTKFDQTKRDVEMSPGQTKLTDYWLQNIAFEIVEKQWCWSIWLFSNFGLQTIYVLDIRMRYASWAKCRSSRFREVWTKKWRWAPGYGLACKLSTIFFVIAYSMISTRGEDFIWCQCLKILWTAIDNYAKDGGTRGSLIFM